MCCSGNVYFFIDNMDLSPEECGLLEDIRKRKMKLIAEIQVSDQPWNMGETVCIEWHVIQIHITILSTKKVGLMGIVFVLMYNNRLVK